MGLRHIMVLDYLPNPNPNPNPNLRHIVVLDHLAQVSGIVTRQNLLDAMHSDEREGCPANASFSDLDIDLHRSFRPTLP